MNNLFVIKLFLIKIAKIIVRHKIFVGIVVILSAVFGYWGYAIFFNEAETISYVTARIQKGELITSISGSGQTSVFNQLDIKPKVSGDIISINVNNGQEVKTGALLAKINSRDAEKTARDAETNLESAKLSLEKLKKPADTLSLIQAENALAQAKESKQKAEDDLEKSYDDGFNTAANAFLDLPTTIVGLYDALFRYDIEPGQWNMDYYAGAVKEYDSKIDEYKNLAQSSYQTAKTLYDKNFSDYKATTRYSDSATLKSLLDETYDTTKSIAEALKSANNLIQFYRDKLTERGFKYNSRADTALTILNTYTGKTNTHLLNLLSIKNTIDSNQGAIASAERLISEKTEALAKLKAGADELDIQSAELTVKQRENALLDAKEKFDDYFIRAPFSGIVAKMNVKKGDAVSPSVILTTLITKQRLAEISLNEVDIAEIKIGQKVSLIFDAIPELAIAGQVAEVDAVGTISQGVVTYTVKIGFDAQDDRVKPGMSVSASIIIKTKQGALLIPNSAVKSQGRINYVEMPADTAEVGAATKTRRQTIKIGLIGDEFTEALEGLSEGDIVITKTIQQNSAPSAQTQQQQSGFRIPGLPNRVQR